MLWFVFALLSAIGWGAAYVFMEKVLHSGISALFFMACVNLVSAPILLALSLKMGGIKSSIDTLKTFDKAEFAMMFLTGALFTAGSVMIAYAVQLKNATHVNLIEISYPLFTILFSYLFFRNVHLDMTAALGAVLIFSGTALILYKGV